MPFIRFALFWPTHAQQILHILCLCAIFFSCFFFSLSQFTPPNVSSSKQFLTTIICILNTITEWVDWIHVSVSTAVEHLSLLLFVLFFFSFLKSFGCVLWTHWEIRIFYLLFTSIDSPKLVFVFKEIIPVLSKYYFAKINKLHFHS